jgi:competence protein ComEC
VAVLKAPFFKGEVIFVWMLLPVICGIFCADFIHINILTPVKYIILILLMFNLVILAAYQKLHLYFKRWVPGALICLSLFCLSFYSTISKKDSLKENYYGSRKGEALLVKINSEPKTTSGIIRFQAAVDAVARHGEFEQACGSLLLALKTDTLHNRTYKYGDQLLISHKIDPIDPPFNPFEFDYKNYLANQGIQFQSFLRDDQVKILAHNKGNGIIAYALTLRQHLVRDLTNYISNKESAALASTLILGYKAELSQEVISAYSKTGTMHVLSVSGMHVLLVFSILQFLLRFLDRNARLRILKVVLILGLIWFYSLLTGFSSAVCRAALMCSIYVFGVSFNRKRNSYNTLAASALLLLIVSPNFLFDAGCQLSYMAVLGLIYLHPKIFHLLDVKNGIVREIWNCASVSMAAQVATVPLSLYYFHQFPLYFLFSNMLIALPVALIMYSGIAFLVLLQFITYLPAKLLHGLGDGLGILIHGVNKSLMVIESMPYASLQFFPYQGWFYMALFLAIILMMIAVQFRLKRPAVASLMIAAVLITYSSFHRIQLQEQQQLILYSLRKNRAISFVEGRHAFVFSDMEPTEKNYTFSVKPSLDAFADRQFIALNHNSRSPVFYDDNFIVFHGWKMLLCDNRFAERSFAAVPEVEAVILSNNPKIKLRQLKEKIKFSMLFADATNKDYRLKQWEEQAKALGIKLYVLKRKRHYSIDLNRTKSGPKIGLSLHNKI